MLVEGKKNWKKKSPQPLTDNKLLTVLNKTENLPVSCGCLEPSHDLLMLSENIYSNLACTRKTPCPERQVGVLFHFAALTRFSWGEPVSHLRCFSNRASKFAMRMGRLPVPNMKVLFDKCSQILSTRSPTHLKVCYCQLLLCDTSLWSGLLYFYRPWNHSWSLNCTGCSLYSSQWEKHEWLTICGEYF